MPIDDSSQDSLLDLLGSEGAPKLVIKRDLNGSVKVEGAVAQEARTAGELRNVFDAGLSRRSIASTLMNAEVSPGENSHFFWSHRCGLVTGWQHHPHTL